MSKNDSGSDSDIHSDWNTELRHAILKKQGESKPITEKDRIEQIQECLDQGADVNTVDTNNNTALHIAMKKRYKKVAQFLIEKGADIYIQNRNGYTALTLAKILGDEDFVSYLKKLISDTSSQLYPAQLPALQPWGEITPSFSKGPSTSQDNVSPTINFLLKYDRQNLKRQCIADNEDFENSKQQRCSAPDTNPQQTSRFDESEIYTASGLKHSLHGSNYQLKLLMLFLHHGLKEGYTFRLATDMDGIGKFDDLMFQYVDETEGKTVQRFLQAKHSPDETRKITARDLLSERNSDYSLQKYFLSYRLIKRHPNLKENKLKDCIVWTNIDFDFEGLQKANICLAMIGESDRLLDFRTSSKRTARYKFVINHQSQLYEILKKTSDTHLLAKTLAEYVYAKKRISPHIDIFKHYHIALAREVVDTYTRNFHSNFVNNEYLSESAENFRNIFVLEFSKCMKLSEKDSFETYMSRQIGKEPLQLSARFGRRSITASINTDSTKYSETHHQLPNDEITSEEISEFFDKLVFAVNQPNEVELGNLITSELVADSRFNKYDTDTVENFFQQHMLDLLKEKDKEIGQMWVFHTNEDATALFNLVERRVDALVWSRLSLSYLELIEEYNIEFKDEIQEVKKFLNPDLDHNANKSVLNLIAMETLLTAIRVHQTINKMKEYNEADSLIFVRLDTLLSQQMKDQLICAFNSSQSHNLLVIEYRWDNKTDLERLVDQLHVIIKKNSAKKLILIGGYIGIPPNIPREDIEIIHDEVSINDLTKTSRQTLLERPVIDFQGTTRVSFVELLGYRSSDTIQSNKSTDFQYVIDANTIVKLICSEEIKMGDDLQKLNQDAHLYVNRKFNHQAVFKNDILKCPLSSELFAISGINKEDLGRLVTDQKDIRSFDEIDYQKLHSSKFVILDIDQDEKQFEMLREKMCSNTKYNIHWLKYDTGAIVWKQSQGKITNLMKYRNLDTSYRDDYNTNDLTDTCLTEDQLLDCNKGCQVVIMSYNHRMANEIPLTIMAKNIKKKYPGLWVININLNSLMGMLQRRLQKKIHRNYKKNKVDKTVDCFVEELFRFKTVLEKKVLKALIKNHGRVALLFDGFDEIYSDYGKTVINMLKAFKKLGIKKLFIFTSPNLAEILEKELDIFCYTMVPFSKIDYREFLISFWKRQLELDNAGQRILQRITIYAEAIAKLLDVKDLVNNPSLIQTIAEIYQDNTKQGAENFQTCKVFLNSVDEQPQLPSEINIVDVGKYFNHKMYRVSRLNKKRSGPGYTGLEGKCGLKMQELKPEENSLVLHENTSKTEQGKVQTGITLIINGKSQVIDREYVKEFEPILSGSLKKGDSDPKKRAAFVKEFVLHPQNQILYCTLLNRILMDNPDPSDWQFGDKMFVNESWKPALNEIRDEFGGTIFHLAAEEGHDEIIKLFLNRLGKQDEMWKFLDNAKDNFGETALYRAAYCQRWKTLKLLVEQGGAGVNCSTWDGRTLLHEAASSGNLDMVKWLIEKRAFPSPYSDDGRTPLDEAAISGQLEVLDWLIDETETDINSRNKNNKTVLDEAASFDQLEVVQWLVKKKAADIKSRDSYKKSVLEIAVDKRSWNVVKWLVEEMGAVYQSDDNSTVLHVAAADNQWEIVKLLAKSDAIDITAENNDGKTVLGYAIESGQLDAVEWLVKNKSIDVNTSKWKNGDTILNYAIACGCLNVVKWLIDNSADLNATGNNDDGSSVCHVAAANKQWDVVKLLVEPDVVNINTENKDGKTVLGYAIESGNLEVIKWLVQKKGIDVNANKFKNEDTILNYAIACGNKDVVKWLIEEKGADLSAKGKNGMTMLHAAAVAEQWELLEWLLDQKGADGAIRQVFQPNT